MIQLDAMGETAKQAAAVLAAASSEQKNRLLYLAADGLTAGEADILR